MHAIKLAITLTLGLYGRLYGPEAELRQANTRTPPLAVLLLSTMSNPTIDPVKRTAELINPAAPEQLERRLKEDIFASIGRIKPAMTNNIDFNSQVMDGDFFATLPAPLQGIAIARCEGALAFYNRVGWNERFLDAELTDCVPADGIEPLSQRYHARTLHDLAYVHPKHFEKMLGKPGTAALWEGLKRFSQQAH